ncbi:MAG: hypothetical protein ABR886_03995 [Dehalococcoidales bacterium]|jgi:hypothetical protein
MKLLITFLLAGILLLGSCTAQPEPYFPVQKEVAKQDMLALLSGKLVMDSHGYLKIAGELILWYHGFSYQIEGKAIWILNDKGSKVFRVGDSVTIGGGELPDYAVEEKIGHPLPENAKGPYWQMAHMAD